jgi:hypothetical protein
MEKDIENDEIDEKKSSKNVEWKLRKVKIEDARQDRSNHIGRTSKSCIDAHVGTETIMF